MTCSETSLFFGGPLPPFGPPPPGGEEVLFFDSLYDADIDYALGCIRTLLKLGADPNWPNQHGITPLMIAAMACNHLSLEVSRILLCFGADPAATDCGGVTENGVVVVQWLDDDAPLPPCTMGIVPSQPDNSVASWPSTAFSATSGVLI